MTEDEAVGWPHRLNGHEFGQALGVGDGQGSLAWRILSTTLLACEMSAIVQQFEHSLALPFFGMV